ncbi:hypothetical protein M9H77_08408 [Catharanthus roseus]|uniref:Uncharacterized protein n=1 Tax=Catharanthus roseus TaxID=4058 RepID=A0ACC0BY39_CATRO|nr:hypothetical protein M9H77_08408 [Catharanthus roseus]
MSHQKKESAMEEKIRVEQESFTRNEVVIESISSSLKEYECKKSVVSTKESEGKTKESECLIENHERNLKLKTWKMKEFSNTSSTKPQASFFSYKQSQFFKFLTTTCGTKSNHGMKAKGEDMNLCGCNPWKENER